MDWCKYKPNLWDPIRQQYVPATPEEVVRQKIIQKMIRGLGYPRSLISIEKNLQTERRFDLLCYRKDNETLKPLLLVECKAGPLNEVAQRQIMGYNYSIGAPFLCLVSGQSIRTLWCEQGKIASVPFLPAFQELLARL